MRNRFFVPLLLAGAVGACQPAGSPMVGEESAAAALLDQYSTVPLTADLGAYSENQRAMIMLLIEAATAMDVIYWDQAYGNRDSLLASIEDEGMRRYVEINYGPWDRLDGNAPFLEGAGTKPAGANYYPPDMMAL